MSKNLKEIFINHKTDFILLIIILGLIFLRYFTSRPAYKNGDRVKITTTITSDPVNYTASTFIRLAGLKIYLPPATDIYYGDKIVVEGVVDGDKLKNPKLTKVENKKGFLSDFRNSLISFYQNNLPEPAAGLLSGIVLGSKSSLSGDFYNSTKLAGVAHVVVASGTNVTFVVVFMMGLTTVFLSRKKAIYFVIVSIVLYLFVAGFEAPLIRAAIMSSILFIGQEKGRLTDTWRIYFLTAGVMLLYKPDWITDLGFILSFVSTGSLMLFEEKIRRRIKFIPEVFKEGLSTSLAAQIGVAPILFVTFGQFNILSPIINALVLWTVPILMVLGVAGGVVGLVFPFLGKLVLWLSYPMLWWFTEIVTIFQF